MVMLFCPIPDFGFRTDNVAVAGAATVLNVHTHTHTNPHPTPAHHTLSVQKHVRLKIHHNLTYED